MQEFSESSWRVSCTVTICIPTEYSKLKLNAAVGGLCEREKKMCHFKVNLKKEIQVGTFKVKWSSMQIFYEEFGNVNTNQYFHVR